MGKIKVLFIDDDTSLQTLARAMLNSETFEFINANRTAEADKILGLRKVDIIVCDVKMPDEEGPAFCRRLRARGDKTPLLFLSAVSNPAFIQEALATGANDYLVKPFDIMELQRKLLAMLKKMITPSPTKTPAPEKKPSGLFNWFKR